MRSDVSPGARDSDRKAQGRDDDDWAYKLHFAYIGRPVLKCFEFFSGYRDQNYSKPQTAFRKPLRRLGLKVVLLSKLLEVGVN